MKSPHSPGHCSNTAGWGSAALALLVLLALPALHAQDQPDAPAEKPLPDIPTLMHQVEVNQRAAEALQQNYLYDESRVFDTLDKKDGIKKTESAEVEVFWLNGVRVDRMLKKNGKPLTPEELKAENERLDKAVAKAKERRDKADAEGRPTDARGHDEISAARILELGVISNPRREIVNGRPTIVVDYTGDPKAKTRNTAESAFKELAGTVWIDEDDRFLQHVEGHFDHDFKLMGGLAVDVKEGTWFKATFVKVNGEVWLPSAIEANGHARYLLFFSLNGHFQLRAANYRKFKATSTILPAAPPDPAPLPPPAAETTPPVAS